MKIKYIYLINLKNIVKNAIKFEMPGLNFTLFAFIFVTASKNLRTRTFDVYRSRSGGGSRVSSWSAQRTTCHSCSDASPNTKIKKVVSPGHKGIKFQNK